MSLRLAALQSLLKALQPDSNSYQNGATPYSHTPQSRALSLGTHPLESAACYTAEHSLFPANSVTGARCAMCSSIVIVSAA